MKQKSYIEIDRMFICELRTNTGPVTISLMSSMGARTIPNPDKQFMFELSLAFQSFIRRKNSYERQNQNHPRRHWGLGGEN